MKHCNKIGNTLGNAGILNIITNDNGFILSQSGNRVGYAKGSLTVKIVSSAQTVEFRKKGELVGSVRIGNLQVNGEPVDPTTLQDSLSIIF